MTAPISNEPTTTRLHHYAGHYFNNIQKRCNSNDHNSSFEAVAAELRAKLVGAEKLIRNSGFPQRIHSTVQAPAPLEGSGFFGPFVLRGLF